MNKLPHGMNPKRIFVIGLLAIICCLLTTSSIVSAQINIIYVDWDATGNNDGSSWADAYVDLQDALAAAITGDEIWVAAGTYKPTDTDDRTISFELKSGVAVYGGFPAEGGDWESRDWESYVAMLNGDIGVLGENNDNSFHVVSNYEVDSFAVMDGFTITGGFANALDHWDGGGMLNNLSDPLIKNVVFIENYSDGKGGGMANYLSNPTIRSSTFKDNDSELGGGIFNSKSNPTIFDVTFSENEAYGFLYWGHGGAIFNSDNSNPTLTNITIIGNKSESGGGIYNDDSNPTLTNVTISGNYGSAEGGGMVNWNSSPTLTNVTFFGNSSNVSGGAIQNMKNSNPTIINNILWDNLPDQISNGDSIPVITYSIIQGGYEGEENLDEDPLLGELADNGGFTMTHALLEGSPAIDAGDPETCLETDQRGVTRPQGEFCDIGAYEYEIAGDLYKIYLPLILR